MTQLNLFDALRAPPTVRPVDPYGDVIQSEPHERLATTSKRYAWHHAVIELHQHVDGMWMWSVSFRCGDHGGGYRVGPKWGKFAETRDDALFYACAELRAYIRDNNHSDAKLIQHWSETILPVLA